jgi:NhaA family Na+:H+ antiporter
VCSYAIFKLERGLHPWIAFFILPLFAFANAGIGIMNLSLNDFTSPVTLGVLLGLCVGKPIGIWMSTFISVKSRVAALPKDVNFFGIYSIAQLAGVGFTMSLFIGALAFHQSALLLQAKLGVIVASMLSGIIGAFALFFV